MLAFAFLATFAGTGLVTLFFKNVPTSPSLTDSSWLFSLTGLVVVYAYFQIPLMLIVFLPSLDGLRQEWYDASASLGGSVLGLLAQRRRADPGAELPRRGTAPVHERLLRLRHGGGPHQPGGSPIVTLQISNAMQSEVVLGQENVGKALALGMIVDRLARDDASTH